MWWWFGRKIHGAECSCMNGSGSSMHEHNSDVCQPMPPSHGPRTTIFLCNTFLLPFIYFPHCKKRPYTVLEMRRSVLSANVQTLPQCSLVSSSPSASPPFPSKIHSFCQHFSFLGLWSRLVAPVLALAPAPSMTPACRTRPYYSFRLRHTTEPSSLLHPFHDSPLISSRSAPHRLTPRASFA